MTDVGKIKLGVEIDAGDLSEKLGEAVRKAILPALVEIQKELNKVQREYDKTAATAEESNAVQVAGAKEVTAALKNIRTAQLEVAAASRAASDSEERGSKSVRRALAEQQVAIDGVMKKMIEAAAVGTATSEEQRHEVERTTRAWNEQTAAIAANTAARIANASTPVGGQPGRDRVGPGRGGFGDNDRNRGGVLGFLTGPTGLNTIALGAQAIPAALTGITALVGAMQQLGQAGLVLPGIYGAFGASLGTAMLGVHGMKDAITALNKAAGPDASAADLKKAADGLKGMSDAGKETAISVSKFTQGPLKDLQKSIQQNMFEGVDKSIDTFGTKTLPRLSGNFNRIGTSWNKTIKTIFGSVNENRNLSLIDRLLGNTAVGQDRATKAINPLIHAFATLASTGGEFLPRLGDALSKVADRFDNFISNAGKTGALWKWIDEGLNGLRALGNSLLNVGKTITGLTHAAGGDEGFLGWLERATQRMQTFVNSTEGQSKLHDFFASGRDSLHEWGDLFKELLPALGKIVEGFAAWGQVTLPIITALASLVNWLGKIPGLVQGAVVAFLAFKTIGGITSGLGKLPFLGGLLGGTGGGGGSGGLLGQAGRTTADKGRAAALSRAALGVGIAGAGTTIQQTGGDNIWAQLLGGAGTIGGTALVGASIGSLVAPGPGTAIGAGVGAGVGAVIAGINVAVGQNAEEAKKAAAANEKLAASMAAEQQAYELTAQAVKTLNDDLIGSKGVFDPEAIAAISDQIGQIPDKLKGALGDQGAKGVGDALKALNLTTDQLSTIVTGAAPGFDALEGRLRNMGFDGQQAADALQKVRDGALQASNQAKVAAPLLQTLADSMTNGDLKQAAADLQNAFAAIPKNVPIKIDAPGGDAVLEILKNLHQQVAVDDKKEIIVTAPLAQSVIDQLEALGVKVHENNDKTITVELDQASVNQVLTQLGQIGDMYKTIYSSVPPPPVSSPFLPGQPAPPGLPAPPHAAGGMVLPGYSPGVDNMMVPLSGGEGIVIPEAMRALGPDWLYGVNSHFRAGISRAGYAGGGVNGYDGGGVPKSVDEGPVIGLLTQIRDLLSGKGGVAGNPMAETADATKQIATKGLGGGAGGAGGQSGLRPGQTGNWGTDFMNGFLAYFGIGPLGGTPLGGIREGAPGYPGAAGGRGGRPAFNAASFAGPLSEFARTGDLTPDLLGLGLDANDPIISAITTARNRKKGGLGGDAISGLVQQVLGGGGFTGELTDQNSTLVRALQTFLERGGSQVGLPGAGAPAAFNTGSPGSAQALINFAQASSGGKYAAASDLVHGLADCSGAVSDLVEFLTKGQSGPGRLFDTHNEAAVLTSLGAVPGLVPGSLQIGLNSGHTAATLPNGLNFESGGGGGGGPVYGGPVGAGSSQFSQQFSLPTDWTGRVSGAGFGNGAGGGASPVFNGSTPGLSNFGGGVVPVYVTNWGGGQGTGAQPQPPGGAPGAAGAGGIGGGGGAAGGGGIEQIGSAALQAAGGVASNVAGDVIHGAAKAIVPTLFGRQPTPTGPGASVDTLANQGNLVGALAQAAGFNVPDFSRAGGTADFQRISRGFDASGRLFSDTGALSDRTTTSTVAAIDAMRAQLVAVGDQTVNKLSDQVLTPVVQAGVTSGFSAVNAAVFGQQGAAMGQAAGPPIASAVAAAIPAASASGGGGSTVSGTDALTSGIGGLGAGLGQIGGVIGGAAGGGLVSGGTPGIDSVPILAQQDEWILNTDDTAKLGGAAGVAAFVGALRSGKLRRLATGGGVGSGNQGSGPPPGSVNATVGADFFGVSQVPLIGTIINLIIAVLLQVIGVNIQSLNTLNNISSDFRSFRGDFKAFDAAGRLRNDTSALVDRSSTSTNTAAQQRLQILKIVLDGLIKFIIDKIIVPLLEAVGQAAVSAAGSAVSSGISAASFGAGGAGGAAASSFIDALGNASIQIAGSIGTDLANAITDVLLQQLAQALPELVPGLVNGLLGGGLITGLLGPLGTVLQLLIGGFLGSITVLFGGAFSGVSTLIPGLPFDDGGIASGVGYLPKATMADELVLSPRNTDIFTRFVGALSNGGFGGNRTVHAPITVLNAGPETPRQVQDRLLRYMP